MDSHRVTTGIRCLYCTNHWFKSWNKEWIENGEMMSRVVFDDECFCDRVKEQGFKIYVDTSVYIEHEKKGLI